MRSHKFQDPVVVVNTCSAFSFLAATKRGRILLRPVTWPTCVFHSACSVSWKVSLAVTSSRLPLPSSPRDKLGAENGRDCPYWPKWFLQQPIDFYLVLASVCKPKNTFLEARFLFINLLRHQKLLKNERNLNPNTIKSFSNSGSIVWRSWRRGRVRAPQMAIALFAERKRHHWTT